MQRTQARQTQGIVVGHRTVVIRDGQFVGDSPKKAKRPADSKRGDSGQLARAGSRR